MKPFTSEQLLRLLQHVSPAATKVLVVDDDPGVVRLVSRAAAAAMPDLKVLTAGSVPEAIALLDERPDVVLLDLVLRDAHGLAVLREVRQRPWGHTLPVVAITAYGFQQEVGSLGSGLIVVRRNRPFTAAELTRWLDGVLDSLPARYLATAG